MPQRTRAAQVSATSPLSPSKLRKPSMPVQKLTRHTAATVPKKTLVKKPSPVKHEQASATVTRRQKRLSSLTAATLLQYCSTILSPSTHEQHQSNTKRKVRSTNTSPLARSIPKKTKVRQRHPCSHRIYASFALDQDKSAGQQGRRRRHCSWNAAKTSNIHRSGAKTGARRRMQSADSVAS